MKQNKPILNQDITLVNLNNTINDQKKYQLNNFDLQLNLCSNNIANIIEIINDPEFNVNYMNEKGNTCLHIILNKDKYTISEFNKKQLIEYLINIRNADYTIKNNILETPFMIAVKKLHFTIIKYFIELENINIYDKDILGNNIYHLLFMNNNLIYKNKYDIIDENKHDESYIKYLELFNTNINIKHNNIFYQIINNYINYELNNDVKQTINNLLLLNDKNNTILTNKFINQYINNFSNKFINTFIINDLNIIKDILDDINEEDNINLNVYNKYIGYEFNKNIYTNSEF